MIHRFVWLLLILALGHEIQAQTPQNPGYLGKRTQIGYFVGTFPELTRNGFHNFLFQHSVHVSTTLSKRVNLRIAGNFTQYTMDGFLPTADADPQEIESVFEIQAPGFSIAFEFFPFPRSGRIAPVGDYLALSFGTYLPGIRRVVEGPDHAAIYGIRPSVSSYGIEWGRNFLVTDRIMLNIAGILAMTGSLGLEDSPTIRRDIRGTQSLQQLLQFKSGLCVLL